MNNLASLALVALGGAVGSVARALIGLALAGRFPWGTLTVNIIGSLLIGWVMARAAGTDPAVSARMVNLLAVGWCGGFTTFSTFSWQTLDQLMKGQWGAAFANVLLSVMLCLLATWLGFRLGRA